MPVCAEPHNQSVAQHKWIFSNNNAIMADSYTFAIEKLLYRTKAIVVVSLVSHKQLCRNSLHSRNKVVFKVANPLQGA